MSSPDFTQQAHDLLQQMSAIVDALIVAVEESRFDDLEGLLGPVSYTHLTQRTRARQAYQAGESR